MRTRLPRRAVVGLFAAAAIVLPTMPAFAAPGDPPPPSDNPPAEGGGAPPGGSTDDSEAAPPEIPSELAPPGGLPIKPPKLDEGALPNPTEPPKPDVPYHLDVGCIQAGPTVSLENRPFAQDALQIDEAHKFATGRDQTVAVIDTGVNVGHPYFGGRARGIGDYVDPAKKGEEDCDGHGTIVAGIIGGNTNPNGGEDRTIGFNGMAPDANILSLRQTSANYKTTGSEDTDPKQRTAGTIGTLAKAVTFAANQPNVKVINISLTSCQSRFASSVPAEFHALQAAVHWAVNDKNVVVVAAAGNLDDSSCPNQNGAGPESVVSIPMPPWFDDDVLSVASVDQSGGTSKFSINGPWVDVAAPGENIISLSPAGDALVNQRSEPDGQQPQAIVGTSFAAPYVSGLAALVRQRYPDLDARGVIHRIEATAQHPANASGRDYEVGYGMINPIAALTDAIPGEAGIKPAQNKPIPARIEPPYQKDWTPTVVALGGTGAGLALLGFTMFTARTVRRNRDRLRRG